MSLSEIAGQQRDWEDLARLDPLYAILTAKGKQLGKWNPDEFFASGTLEIKSLMSSCGFRPGHNGRVLDFGCGIGRLSRALRLYFGEVYAVDISEQMIVLAREATPSVNFAVNSSPDLQIFENNFFDFVYSNIVLQHQPTQEMAQGYIREFVRVVRPSGIVVFQVPCKVTLRAALQSKRRLYFLARRCGFSRDFAYKRLRLDPMQTGVALSLDDVQETLVRNGARLIRSYPDTSNCNSITYVVTKGN